MYTYIYIYTDSWFETSNLATFKPVSEFPSIGGGGLGMRPMGLGLGPLEPLWRLFTFEGALWTLPGHLWAFQDQL